jgi:hypothetical protein
MQKLQKQKKYKIFLYENINGLGCLNDQGFSFDTWQQAYDKKAELQKDGKLPKSDHLIQIDSI